MVEEQVDKIVILSWFPFSPSSWQINQTQWESLDAVDQSSLLAV